MTSKNTPPKETNAANQKTEAALDDATCSSWICDCKSSNVRWVDKERPHPAIAEEGWFCMGCLTQFSIHEYHKASSIPQIRAAVERMIGTTNIPLSAARVRVAAIEEVLKILDGIESSETNV